MKRLTVLLDCGETTCASEPGKFCQYVRVSGFGTRYSCHLFGERLTDTDGWLTRLTQCLEAGR